MTGIIILAAGQSSRMGTPKQQLVYNNATLLQHAIHSAVASDAGIVLVVLGYDAGNIQPPANNTKLHFVVNNDWHCGMGTSISTGIRYLQAFAELNKVIIMVSDQPLVTPALLNSLITTNTDSAKGIVACRYAGTIGVPALFDKIYFSALAALQGDGGAKKIIQQFTGDVAGLDFPGGETDIDTPGDFQQLLANQS